MAERPPPDEVFTTFYDGGGWGSLRTSALVGLSTPFRCFVDPDAGVQMSEELNNASVVLAKAVMWAVFFNGVFGIFMMITSVFCGGALESLLESPTGIIVLQTVYNATVSCGDHRKGHYTGRPVFFAAVSVTAAYSRQIWACFRDQGLPFSSWIEHVRPGWDIPVNALLACLGYHLSWLASTLAPKSC